MWGLADVRKPHGCHLAKRSHSFSSSDSVKKLWQPLISFWSLLLVIKRTAAAEKPFTILRHVTTVKRAMALHFSPGRHFAFGSNRRHDFLTFKLFVDPRNCVVWELGSFISAAVARRVACMNYEFGNGRCMVTATDQIIEHVVVI